ncbi:MAG: histidine phosphatase family protein [Chloroflexota bacterium]|nr:histidine phosphatase family protein [Anaerolineales bacterium]MCA9976246.1 histidine phosphatase family protein [Anaerolineales bacterium]MCB8966490.1 histidine phosphatase family protein [Ardenticatenaceae bacterium]
MSIRTVYLLRHAQEDRDNRADVWGGPLTRTGVAQAQAAATFLQNVPFTVIYASTLRRARHTAKYIAQYHPGVPLMGTNLLWECIPSVPHLSSDTANLISPEHVQQDRERIALAYERYFSPPENGTERHDLIVCHGNLIRYFVCRILHAPLEMWVNLEMCNCGLTRVEIRPNGRRVLIAHNESCYLPESLITFV